MICIPIVDKHIFVFREVMKLLIQIQRNGYYCKIELRYLRYVVNQDGLMVDPEKVEAILKTPSPNNASEIRQIVDMAC